MDRYDDLAERPPRPALPRGDGSGRRSIRKRAGSNKPPGKIRRRTILRWTSVVTTVVLVAASLAAYAAYRNVIDGVRHINVANLLGKRPPQYDTSAMNILVIGSDSRAGANGQFGSAPAIPGARSDTMMLLHILPQHRGGVVISFPRDSVVPVIACPADGAGNAGQKAQPGATEMLNATFALGGPACLWKTLESMTGIFIDHFVEINFNGFQSVLHDLAGVHVRVRVPADASRRVGQQPQAGQRFSAVAHDQSVARAKPSKKAPGPAGSAKPSASPSSAPPVSPVTVQVKVLNATATGGLAGKTGTALTQRHFTVIGTGNAVAPSATTIIQYSSASAAARASALAQIVP